MRRSPYWISVPNTNTAKLDGQTYQTPEAAIQAAEARVERPIVVYGTMPIFGYPAPSVVRVID